jgi:hypothetical protein
MLRFICLAVAIAMAVGCSKGKSAKSGTNEQSWSPPPRLKAEDVLRNNHHTPVSPTDFGDRPSAGPIPQAPPSQAGQMPAQMNAGIVAEVEQEFKPLHGRALYNRGLRRLGIEFRGARIAEGTLKRMERYSEHITTLTFIACEVSDSELQTLPELPWLMQLEMTNCSGYTDRGIEKLVAMKRLTTLRMGGTPIGDGALAIIGQIDSLKTLDLSSTHVTDTGLKNLASLTNLALLNLNRTQVNGPGLNHLTPLSKLSTLYLAESGVTDDGLAHIANIPGLTWIILDGTAVGDAGLKAVIENIPSITDFNLKGTKVTDLGAKVLASRPVCHKVDLSKSRVTKMGIDELKAKFPKNVVLGP